MALRGYKNIEKIKFSVWYSINNQEALSNFGSSSPACQQHDSRPPFLCTPHTLAAYAKKPKLKRHTSALQSHHSTDYTNLN